MTLMPWHFEIPMIRLYRESGNPEKSKRWVPAYAGMTGFSSFPPVVVMATACTSPPLYALRNSRAFSPLFAR
jgi:hypothetical protein